MPETSSIQNQNTDINNFIKEATNTQGFAAVQAYQVPNVLQPVLITNPEDFAISTTFTPTSTPPVKLATGQTLVCDANESFALTNAYQTIYTQPSGSFYLTSLTICGGRGVTLSDNGVVKFAAVIAGGFTNTDTRHYTFPIPIKFSTNVQIKSDANNTQDVTLIGWYE